MYRSGFRRVQLRELPTNKTSTGEEQLNLLQHLIAETIPDRTTFDIYVKAIEELRKSFMVFNLYEYNHGATDAFLWVHRVPEKYLLLLRDREQESLCIFAFFCVLLHQMNSIWWGKGWGTRLMAQAEAVARSRGCHGAWLDTSSARAERFYARLGYAPFGVLRNEAGEQPQGHRRAFLAKRLTARGG